MRVSCKDNAFCLEGDVSFAAIVQLFPLIAAITICDLPEEHKTAAYFVSSGQLYMRSVKTLHSNGGMEEKTLYRVYNDGMRRWSLCQNPSLPLDTTESHG